MARVGLAPAQATFRQHRQRVRMQAVEALRTLVLDILRECATSPAVVLHIPHWECCWIHSVQTLPNRSCHLLRCFRKTWWRRFREVSGIVRGDLNSSMVVMCTTTILAQAGRAIASSALHLNLASMLLQLFLFL
eukprot:2958834-Pleurochrysis_carterae.AAC.3